MTKAELIGVMAEAAGISRDQAKLALEAFTDNVTTSLTRGRDVRLVGFGSFIAVDRKAGTVTEPRAVSIDDESLRTMQAASAGNLNVSSVEHRA